MQSSNRYQHCSDLLGKILPHKYALHIHTGLEGRFGGLEQPSRAIRSLVDFLEFIAGHDAVIESSTELSLFFHNYQECYMEDNRHKAPLTISSDLNTLSFTIARLQSLGVFPDGHIAPVKRQAEQEIFQDASEDAKKVLGGLELPTQSKDEEEPLTLRLNAPSEEFLDALIQNIRKHRNTILHISRCYLAEASKRFDYKKIALDLIPESLFDDPENLTQCKNPKGQRYSLFNPERLGELARLNLIAYLHYKQNGLVTKDFKGRTYLNSFGGTTELREYFGISALSAVAAQNIIIIESGINVDSLRGIELCKDATLKNTFRITDDGFNIIYEKKRASSPRNKEMNFVDESDININFAFDYLLRSTEYHRTLAPPNEKNFLFLHDSTNEEGVVRYMSAFPFKYGFKKLLTKARERISQDPMWCQHVTVDDIDELLEHAPNAKQLRVSEGILRWFDSGGDPFVASSYLGNSESVALRNYIPSELQGVLYSHQISRFQHLLLAAATDEKSYSKAVLGLDTKDGSDDSYQLYISQLDAINPNWRNLAESGAVEKSNTTDEAFALIMTKDNVARLYKAFMKENSVLLNGVTPDEETSLLSDIFKNLVSYVNAHGTRPQRTLLRDIIISGGE
ncbi:hypothetical protein QNE41_001053 [Vibrio parahaemolyticus]|nr:hypothetical protein [Vibrio parahaemolyticus]